MKAKAKRSEKQRPGPCFRRGEKEAKIDDRRKAVTAVHFMQTYPGAGIDPDNDDRARADGRARRLGMRPLKPPPGRPAPATRTAAQLALAEDRRRGIIGGLPFRLEDL